MINYSEKILNLYEWQPDKNCFNWCIEQSISANLSGGNIIILILGISLIIQYLFKDSENKKINNIFHDLLYFNMFLIVCYFGIVYYQNF